MWDYSSSSMVHGPAEFCITDTRKTWVTSSVTEPDGWTGELAADNRLIVCVHERPRIRLRVSASSESKAYFSISHFFTCKNMSVVNVDVCYNVYAAVSVRNMLQCRSMLCA